MGAYIMHYKGEELDKTIEFVLNFVKNSTNKTLDSTPENPIDLNDLIVDEGVYTCQHFIHSADDADNSAVVLAVVFEDPRTVMQQYDLNGTSMRRYYSFEDNEWTDWIPVKPILTIGQNDSVTVAQDTLVLREITGDVEDFFENSEAGE